jgi:hypothetical protein
VGPVVFPEIEKLKQEYTDKYVEVVPGVAELARFGGHVGQIKTVNMNGRALVEFDAWNNIGWYDIDLSFLKVVPKPEAAAAAKAHDTKQTAPRPATKVTPTMQPGEKKLSALEMARMQGAAKPGGTKAAAPAAEKPAAGGKPSTADILAAARANKAAAAGATKPASPAPAAKPAAAPTGKMNTADILAAARANKAAAPTKTEAVAEVAAPAAEEAAAPTAAPAAAPTKPKPAAPALAPGQKLSVPQILDWCRQHDAK